MEIRIQAIQFDADKKLLEFTKSKVEKLEHFSDNIIDIDVYLRIESAHGQVKEKAVEVKLNLPGATLFVKEHSKSFEVSVDKAVEALTRQVKKHKEKLKN